MKLSRSITIGILSMLALLIAISGTAVAANVLPKNSVGAKQIKPNAVRSSDIKNGTVGLQDLSAGANAAIADAAGAPTAYQEADSRIQFVGATEATFASMDVAEAGDYLITANLRVFPRVGNPGDNLYCNILGGGQAIQIVNHGVDMPAGVAQVTMHGILPSLPAGTNLKLRCRAGTNEVTLTYDWTAVQVDLG